MWKKASLTLVVALMLSLALFLTTTLATSVFAGNPPGGNEDHAALAPEVLELVQGSYLAHPVEVPDPNENVEALRIYLQYNGAPNALPVFRKAVSEYPGSRHLHFGLARALWEEYEATQQVELSLESLDHVLRAVDLGLRYQNRPLYLWLVNEAGIASGRVQQIKGFYRELLRKHPDNYEAALYHALFLAKAGDMSADDLFRKAISLRTSGNIDAVAYLAERLLDRGQWAEALSALTVPGESNLYLAFLRGVALEHLGQRDEAAMQYQQYREFNQVFPAPSRYRIKGSQEQVDLLFDDETSVSITANGEDDLSWVIACEAGGESGGGMRAVGWSVRQRAVRGNDGCVATHRSGTTLSEWYSSVICYPAQYAGVQCSSGHVVSCSNSNSRTPTSDDVAYKVYYGLVPDPQLNYCPDGLDPIGTNACTTSCRSSNTTSWDSYSAHSFYGNSVCGFTYSCYEKVGFTCSDGYPDNCFYRTKQ